MSLASRIKATHTYLGPVPGSLQDKLIAFHDAFNVPILPTPQVPPDDRVRLRARLIAEEFCEFLEACFGSSLVAVRGEIDAFISEAGVRVDLVEASDALADIAYVVEGANLEFGVDSGPVLDEVHRSNMAKLGGEMRADGKLLKPAGWTPPDIAGVLEKQK